MAAKKTDSPKTEEQQQRDRGTPGPGQVPADETRDFEDAVNEASDESFPASDPPAWTDTTASKNGK